MGNNTISFGQLRNEVLFASKTEAINGIQANGTNDGVIKLARYTEHGEIKTIFGIAYTKNSVTSYTIYDSFKEVIENLQSQIDDITGSSESISGQIKEAIDELKGDVSEDYDTLEKIENIIKLNKENGVVTLESTDGGEGTNISKTYTIKQGGVFVGSFDIYKDSFLKSVNLITKDGRIIDDEHPGIAYAIPFVFVTADGSEQIVNIPISSFIQDLEAGNGLIVDANGRLNIVKDAESENFLVINEDSIAIVGVQNAIDTAIATLNSELTAALNAEIERAKEAERILREGIEAETSRAIVKETELSDAIEAETTRAENKESELLSEINKITINGTYGVSAITNENRTTTIRAVVDDNPLVDTNPLTVTQNGIRFATDLDCGLFQD